MIKRSNYINKDILKWRAEPLIQRIVALFWTFFKAAHKKKRLKNWQGHEEASSVMLQEKLSQMANCIGELERYIDNQQTKANQLVDQVNESSSRSWSDWSIPGMIDTSESGASLTELSTTQALIASL